MRVHFGLRSLARRGLPANLHKTLKLALHKQTLCVDWVDREPIKNNWGDAVAPRIVGDLSGRPVVNARDVIAGRNTEVHVTIGSMLGSVRARRVTVWGTGFVSADARPKTLPMVMAVRGPLTRRILLDAGIDCPEIFGDPALCYALFHPQRREPTYELGVIAHWAETGMDVVQGLGRDERVKLIDIRGGLERVPAEINECRLIASASLHGMVCADGYGIPTAWVRFSDKPSGGGFKFRDYLGGVGRSDHTDLQVTDRTTPTEIIDHFDQKRPQINMAAFLAACPFLDPTRLPSIRE